MLGNCKREKPVTLFVPPLRRAPFVVRLPVLFAACLIALGASQPWTSKDFTLWTAAEVEKVLTDSPWAQQVMASFGQPLQPEDMPVTPPPGAQGGMAGSRGVSDGRWDGGVARNTGIGDVPSLPITVRWDSALPVRQALSRSQKDNSVSARAVSDYIITIIGLASASPRTSAAPGDESRGGVEREPQDPAQVARAFIGNSALLPRGKPAIAPEDAKFDAATGAVQLFFPRSARISLSDKEVTFVTRFGSLTVQKKFHLKDMTFKGQLEL
jgi:hypothetical protein